jgi:hypothetical protein
MSTLRHLASIAAILALCAAQTGCLTNALVDEAAGADTRLEFAIVDDSPDNARIFWRESPYTASSLLRVNADLPECERLSPIGTDPVTVDPSRLDDREAEMAQWQYLPDGPCSVLISAGYIVNDLFLGLSFSTREDGVFQQFEVGLSEDRESSPTTWFLLPWAWMIYEPVYAVTIYPLLLVSLSIPVELQEEVVTVSFDMPDGNRLETTLQAEEALNLLAGQYYRETKLHRKAPWLQVRFWVRAALAKLSLDYREEVSTHEQTYWEDTNQLVYVDGHWGPWRFDPRDGRAPRRSLYEPLGESRVIRLSLVDPQRRRPKSDNTASRHAPETTGS